MLGQLIPKPKKIKHVTGALDQLVTELILVEDELANLQEILQDSSDAILITEPSGKILYANPAWENLTGYSFQEIKGKDPIFLKSGKTPRKVFRDLWIALTHGISYATEDIINKRKDGTEYQLRASFFPVKRNDKLLYYVQIQQDITQRKKLEELKKEFLSVAAHELKSPITTLKLMSQAHIAKFKRYGSDEIKLDELELLDRELERITQLINDILDDTRIENGRLFLDFKITNISKLLNMVVRKMKLISTSHKIILMKLPKISTIADQQRLEQVFINLISNAVKYSKPRTKITIGASVEKKKAVIYVKDSGIGIQKTHINKIFDRFYQIEQKGVKGFGLGLYISREIVHSHKGNIWAESKLGKGSTFYVTLPIKKI